MPPQTQEIVKSMGISVSQIYTLARPHLGARNVETPSRRGTHCVSLCQPGETPYLVNDVIDQFSSHLVLFFSLFTQKRALTIPFRASNPSFHKAGSGPGLVPRSVSPGSHSLEARLDL